MSFEIKEALKQLCLSVGVAGSEEKTGQLAASLLQPYCKQVTCDAYGNVYGEVVSAKEGQPTVLLEAHLDEIGLVVTHIDDSGFLKVSNCGGVDRRLLLAQQVTVHGKEDIKGIITSKPPHLESDEEQKKTPEFDRVAIDIGMSKKDAEQVVSLGDKVTFDSCFRELLHDRVSVKSLDDRAGVVSLLYALELLQGEPLNCGLSVLFSSQEEVGERGATIAGYRLQPDIALSVDVSFGHTPDAPEHKCGKLGGGAMIGVAPSLTKEISDLMIILADKQGIPYQLEVMGGETGTDADTIGVLHGGIKTGLVSIPLRYMHTPIETVALEDIEAVGKLLAVYLKSIGKERICHD